MAGIMKAKKKPIDVVQAEELGVPFQPRVEVLRYRSSDTKRKCERLATVDELADRLIALTAFAKH
jgi:electron transfer flavoprotein alpha/beta subunit